MKKKCNWEENGTVKKIQCFPWRGAPKHATGSVASSLTYNSNSSVCASHGGRTRGWWALMAHFSFEEIGQHVVINTKCTYGLEARRWNSLVWLNNANNKLYFYNTFHTKKCSWKCFTTNKSHAPSASHKKRHRMNIKTVIKSKMGNKIHLIIIPKKERK